MALDRRRRPRCGRPLRSLAFAAILVTIAGACAQIEPPSGGPEDKEPPRVVATFPDSGAVGVPLTDSLVLVFSEPMDRESVAKSYYVSPPVEYRERRWQNESWILRLREPLQEGRTYVGLLGIGVRDAHRLSPKAPWSFAFSTGDSIDTGRIEGRVFGQRYAPAGALLWVWPWAEEPPDTLTEGYPAEPLRLGQADSQGNFALEYLPRGVELRICALYDRQADRRYNPATDRWDCAEDPVVIADTARVVRGIDLYLAYPDEPGTVSGSVVDSACVASTAGRSLERVRASRDSLRQWLEGGPGEGAEISGRGEMPDDEATAEEEEIPREILPPPPLTEEDSLRVGRELLRLDSLEVAARAESLYCGHPLYAQLVVGDTAVVRESRGTGKFEWKDVSPGIYRLRGFRDLSGDGAPDPGEPFARFGMALEVRPLRVLSDIRLVLEGPAGAGVEPEPPPQEPTR